MKFNRYTENLIANLRGLPEDCGRSVRRKAKSMSELSESFLEKYKVDQPSMEDVIMTNWKSVVGEHAAHRCRPVRIINNRKLLIVSNNSVMRSELLFKKADILKKLQALPRCVTIRELLIQQG